MPCVWHVWVCVSQCVCVCHCVLFSVCGVMRYMLFSIHVAMSQLPTAHFPVRTCTCTCTCVQCHNTSAFKICGTELLITNYTISREPACIMCSGIL